MFRLTSASFISEAQHDTHNFTLPHGPPTRIEVSSVGRAMCAQDVEVGSLSNSAERVIAIGVDQPFARVERL